MADCEYVDSCIFFEKAPRISSMGSIITRDYCKANFSSCARYKVTRTLGRQNVPSDLDPMMHYRADMIINEGKAYKQCLSEGKK